MIRYRTLNRVLSGAGEYIEELFLLSALYRKRSLMLKTKKAQKLTYKSSYKSSQKLSNRLSDTLKRKLKFINKIYSKMELQHYTKSKMESRSEELTVTLNMYSSNIIFNQQAIDHFSLKRGDRIVFSRDEDSGNWFFHQTAHNDAFPLRTYAGSKMLAFSCKNLCRRIINEVDDDAYKVVMKVDKQVVNYEETDLFKLDVMQVEMDEFLPMELKRKDPTHQTRAVFKSPAPAIFR